MHHSGKEMVAAVTPGGEGLGVGATEPSKPSTQTRQCGSPGREMLAMIGVWRYFRPTARRIVASPISAVWSFFFNHWATSRQIDKFDTWSGGPAVPHNSIAACLTRSRSGLRVACGVVAQATTRVDVVISDNSKLVRLKRFANDCRSSSAAYVKTLTN